MKSRLALSIVLALGILFSGAGATLAVSGLSADGSAGSAQYRQADPGEDPGEIGASGDPGVVTTEQVAVQGEGELPLTGFLAVPLLIAGVALLTTGVVIRRKARD
jgi:LPXTG-motif cell wall-anchored protein